LEAFLFNLSVPTRPFRSAGRARHVRLSALLLLLAGLLTALPRAARAQTTGAIDGIVRDTSGALVPGAKITLINEQSKAIRTTTSNGEGYFTIEAVQANTYDLLVSMPGFDAYRVNGIDIHPGDHTNIAKIALKVGEVTQEITVNATTAGVALDSGEKSALITADDIARLSTVGRDATELIKILPGFAVSTGGGLSNNSTANTGQVMGFGSSSTSSFSAVGSTPQTGMTTVVSDGASVMDPGDMGASISNVNMDMVQEVKVSTSNFGADGANGPVVINAIGKSGGSQYHGSTYLFARNVVLNSNDWYSNYEGQPRPQSKFFYPGGNIGGPLKIPGTDFNHNKKLTFFFGFEVYDQTVPDGQASTGAGLLQGFVPTPAMLAGDLTPGTIATALNVPGGEQALTTACPNFYTNNGGTAGSLGNSQGVCYSPGFNGGLNYTQQDCLIIAGKITGASPKDPTAPCVPGAFPAVDPHTAAWAKFWPKPNRQPQAVPAQSLLSDGYNYEKTEVITDNGYQAHARIDENFTDSLKLYVTYNFEAINAEEGVDNVYYDGSDFIPYPTPDFSHTKSNGISINLTKVFGPSLTNELIGAGNYYYSPVQLANRAEVQDASTGWSGGRYYNNNALQLPGIVDYEEGVPDFGMGYFPAGSAFLRKFSYDGADNLTKQWRTHSIKVGAYAEVTANNQIPYNYTQGVYAFNHYNAGCVVNPDPVSGASSGDVSQLQNNVANFDQGCGGFSQSSSSQNADLHFHTYDFYLTDEWKATRRLTLTYGLRFDHMGAWFDPDGLGMAVWTPPAQHVVYNVTQNPATYPGISWHQTDKSDPISGQPSRPFFYSPRAGLSYDLYGNGKTTLRGGFGAYRFHDSYNDSAGPLSTTLGIEKYQNPSNISCTIEQIGAQGTADAAGKSLAAGYGCPVAAGTASLAPFAIYALDKHDDEQPMVYNYSFNVDQVMPWNSNLELSYVGNQSHNTFTEGNLSNQNYIPLGGLFQPDPITGVVTQPSSTQQNQQDYYPYPNYAQVYVPHHIGYGNYNSLQASWNRQKGAFIYGFNYTWSKALGIRGDYRTGAVGDPSTLRNNYGYLGFNRSNAVNATYSWQVGNAYHGNRFVGAVLNRWEISGITSLQSGPDVAVLNGTSNTNFGLGGGIQYTPAGSSTAIAVPISNTTALGTPSINLQPVVTCDPRKNLHTNPKYGVQYFNGNCFALPKLGTNGDFELPDVHGPAYFDTDLTVKRSFKLREKQELVFSLAGFNFLNHPLRAFTGGANLGLGLSYGLPAGYTATSAAEALAAAVQTSPNFGYTPYKSGYRIVELGARYNF
jgi:hypothetical protein